MVANLPFERDELCWFSGRVVTKYGVRVTPDRVGTDWPEGRDVLTFSDRMPADALHLVLDAITARYGARTADVVAMQREYPRPTTDQ